MGYLYLAGSLVANFAKGFCGKLMSGLANTPRKAYFFTFLRMSLCFIIAAVILAVQGQLSALAVTPTVLIIALLSGVGQAAQSITWLLSARKDALLLVEVFVMLGVFVTVFLSWGVLGEQPTALQLIGLVLLLAASLVICSYNTKIKTKLTPSALLLLCLCGLASGLTDFSQKLFAAWCADTSRSVFNFYTFAVCAVVVGLFLLTTVNHTVHPTQSMRALRPVAKWLALYISIMALGLYVYAFCKTAAASYLPAVQLYPLFQGFTLLNTCIMATLFKEKVTVRAVIGLLIAFAGLLMINL